MEIKIDTFEKLIQVIENHNLTKDQRNELVRLSLKLIVLKELNKTTLIKELRTYWSKFKDTNERPIFLGVDESTSSIGSTHRLDRSAYRYYPIL